MPGLSIAPPRVEVTQEFISESPTITESSLPTVIIGPAFQVISAFDDNGDPLANAFAGTYRDGLGQIAYSLPSLVAQASLAGFSDEVRTFLLVGSDVRELNSVADEQVIIESGTGDYTNSTLKLVDVSQLFLQTGVEAGDVVRLTFRAEELDIPIASVDSDTQLTLEASIIAENLAGVSYDIVRNPAEFLFTDTLQANTEFGTDADYIRFTCQSLKTDGLTPAAYRGSAGDSLSLTITDTTHYIDGVNGAVGDTIFFATTADFVADVGAVGDVTGFYLFTGDPLVDTNGLLFREVLEVGDPLVLVIESGEGVGLSGLTWRVVSEVATGIDGVTAGTAVFTSAGALFNTTIPNIAGTPTGIFFIEIEGDGVYRVNNVDSDTQLTLANLTANNGGGQTYTVGRREATGSAGSTGALTTFFSREGGFSALTGPTTKSVNVGGLTAKAITTFDTNKSLTLTSGFAVSASGLSFSIVETAAPLTLTFDADTSSVVVQLARVGGVSGNTYLEVVTAITSALDPSYNVLVADVITAAVQGSGSWAEADLPIALTFDGGADTDTLLLDADLLGSTTPTAQVYVSYKALRVDLSDQATDPVLWSIDDTTQLEDVLGTPNTDNPLALGVFYALANAPTRSIKAIGVSAVSASKPDGTLEAYVSALEFLESQDVYTLVVLTQDPTVHQVLQAHVDAMSEPDAGGERIGFFNQAMPAYSAAEVIASGTQGNTGTFVGQNPAEFSASVNFLNLGVQVGDILVVGALASATDSPDVVNGTVGPLYGLEVLGVKTGDPFVLELDASVAGVGAGWDTLIDVSFTVYRSGTAIVQKADQAEQLALTGEGFADRRMFFHWPDVVTADVDGVTQLLEGFYCASGWGGKVAQARPQQGFSNVTVKGFTGLKHSNKYFSRAQLNRIAGGGTFITIQESANAPLRCRHQLSTDTSTLERRELSITKIIDHCARFLRTSLSSQVGAFNITQSFLDGLSTSVEGLLRSLVESSVVLSADIVTVEVDPVQPDKVNITVALDVPYPVNIIALTLQI